MKKIDASKKDDKKPSAKKPASGKKTNPFAKKK